MPSLQHSHLLTRCVVKERGRKGGRAVYRKKDNEGWMEAEREREKGREREREGGV